MGSLFEASAGVSKCQGLHCSNGSFTWSALIRGGGSGAASLATSARNYYDRSECLPQIKDVAAAGADATVTAVARCQPSPGYQAGSGHRNSVSPSFR